MARPTAAQMYPPLLILRYLGNKAVMSVPAETELAAILVPSWANANAKEIMKTPNLAGPFALSPLLGLIKKYPSSSSGFQMGFP